MTCLAGLGLAGLLGPVPAAADWGPPQTVERVEFGPSEFNDLQLLGNPGGDRSIVWTMPTGQHDMATWERWWPAGGPLGPARQIGTSGVAAEPRAALGPDGTQAIAWGLRVAVRPPGGEFGAPETLPGTEYRAPEVVVDARGTVYVLWLSALDRHLHVAARPPGGSFGEPQVLAPGHVREFHAAADAQGNLLVGWVRHRPVPPERRASGRLFLELAERDPAGRLSPVRRLATGRFEIQGGEQGGVTLSFWDVAVRRDAAGAALITWWDRKRMWLTSRTAGGVASVPRPLLSRSARPIEGVGGTAMAVAPSGRAVVVHEGRARFGSTTGRFGRAQPLYGPARMETAGIGSVAIDRQGRAVALLSGRTTRRRSRLFALTRPPGGRFGAAQAIGWPFEGVARLTLDDRGTSTAAFLQDADLFATKRLQVVTDEPRYSRAPAVGVVVAAPALTRRGRSASAALRRGIAVRLYLSKAARFALTVRMRGVRGDVAGASGRFARAGMRTVRVRLSAAGRRRLRAAGGARLTVRARAVDAQGRRGTASRGLRLGRAR